MKVCSRCNISKDLTEFGWRVKAKQILHYHCKECGRQDSKRWYKNNKETHIRNVRKQKEHYTQIHRNYISSLNLKCSNCGFDHPGALDFHHRDRLEKDLSISDMILRGTSLNKIKKEIDKCDVLCSNCHRILHWNERQK